MEEPFERTSVQPLCSGGDTHCSRIPWGGFWLTCPQGATQNTRAEGSIAVPCSPHTAQCRKGHGTFPLGVWPLCHSLQVLLQTGGYSLCFLVLTVVGSSTFVFFSIRSNKTILLFRDCQKRRFRCRWWVQTCKQKFILWMLFQNWVLLSDEGNTSSLMPRDCLIKK